MINVSIAGIGGQGSVLAARILAQAAEDKGWQVRTAETTGMAQRGGCVVSHIRMGNKGETVYSPMPAKGTVDVLIALEPGEGARALPLLKKDGLLIIARTGIPSSAFEPNAPVYDADALIEELRAKGVNLIEVDDYDIRVRTNNHKALNIMMLTYALIVTNTFEVAQGNALCNQVTLDEMRDSVRVCLKPKLVDSNLKVIDFLEQTVQA